MAVLTLTFPHIVNHIFGVNWCKFKVKVQQNVEFVIGVGKTC